MTRYDDEILMRRIDGELSVEAGERIDAEALNDPELAARLARMRALKAAAREAFAVQPDPRDQALARLIAGSEPVAAPWTRFTRAIGEAFAPRRAALWGGLAAATFIGGLMIGPLLDGRNDGFVLAPGGEIADAGLVRVLDRRLASEGADGEGRAVVLTFRDGDGRWCRTFQAGDAGVAGLACRANDAWSIRALAPSAAGSGEIRTAGTDTPAAVLAAVDASLAGDVLDAGAEAEARDAGWR